jgi:hypothetical protein
MKEAHLRRIMRASQLRFNHEEVAEHYIAMYEEMLARPLVERDAGRSNSQSMIPPMA